MLPILVLPPHLHDASGDSVDILLIGTMGMFLSQEPRIVPVLVRAIQGCCL